MNNNKVSPQSSSPPPPYPQQYQQYNPGESESNPASQPQRPQQFEVITVTQPAVTVATVGGLNVVGESPTQVTCPNCRSVVVTAVTHEIGSRTWLIFFGLCLLGCWPCSFIPFCVDGCKDVVHSCPSCDAVVGRYRRM